MDSSKEAARLYDFYVEYQDRPLGLDVERPRFSWKMDTKRRGARQRACRLTVKKSGDSALCYDSGVVEKGPEEVIYGGEELAPCTRYDADVTVWDETGEEISASTWFETGLMNPDIAAWEGAQFIGPSRYTMCAAVRGIFALETTLCIAEGSRIGGVVFGAGDERLLDARMNDFGIEGENYIRYEMDVAREPAEFHIYRVGYAKEDAADVPFAVFDAVDFETKEAVVTRENAHDPHALRIEVTGNAAYTYVDGHLVDAVMKTDFMGVTKKAPRQLNPRGDNDCITYPRLNGIGFYAGPGDTVRFDRLEVRNLRTPCAAVVCEKPSGGLYGEDSIFGNTSSSNRVHRIGEGELSEQDGWFCLSSAQEGCQISAYPSPVSIPMLRFEFALQEGKTVETARLYATARGIYECRINAAALSEDWFQPGCTQFDRHLLYQTFDITDLLREKENALGVVLASGWWSDSQTYVLQNYNLYGDRESFLGKMVIRYTDGSQDVFITDPETWKYYGKGPYRYAGFFQGERLDGREMDVYEAFSLPGFDDADWERPEVIRPVPIRGFADVPMPALANWPDLNETEPDIVGSYQAPVRAYCRLEAGSMTEPRTGLYVYDLGQEMAGVPSIRLHEKAGTVVTIRFGEMLYPDLPEYGNLHGMLLLENYRDASGTDVYICRGDGDGEVYMPRFTSHGFRYIEISGTSSPPQLSDVAGIQLSSVKELTGAFESSHPLLNRFVENVRWSQLCNFISIPTDCPQRNERMGWAGDTHVFAGTANRNADLRLFYYRNLEGFCDLQKNGKFPEIAPTGGGFGGITYESAPIYITWELYLAYGDKEIVRRMYPSLCEFMTYLAGAGMPGTAFAGPLGDWLAPEETDASLLWNAFYVRNCLLMKKMAAVLGDAQKETFYDRLYQDARAYWNETFLDPETKTTVNARGERVDTQCSYALPLIYGVVRPEDTGRIGDLLAKKVEENGMRISTGFFGTGLINEALTQTGHADLAWRLMLQEEYPSWLYPVTQGATTVWERWNSFTVENGFGGNNAMNSFNHYSLGSVVTWLYRSALGIREDEEAPGYRHILLQPHAQALEYAAGAIETPCGRVESAWKREEAAEGISIHYSFRIPPNASATLHLTEEDLPGGRTLTFCDEDGIKFIASTKEGENSWETFLTAGTWDFISSPR